MKTLIEIQQRLDETVNQLLGQHRGRIDAVGFEAHPEFDDVRALRVKMSGGCQGCAGAKATLRTIVAECVMEFDSSIVAIVDATDHTDKTNAFFKE